MNNYKKLDFYVVKGVINTNILHEKMFSKTEVRADELLVKWKRIENFTEDINVIRRFINANKLNFTLNKENTSVTLYPTQYAI